MAITKVTNSLVATNAIQGTLIADNAITSVHIAQNQVTSVQIPDGSITSTQLAANSVDTAELVTGSIDTIHLSNNAVTSNKIATNSVVTETIAQNSITAVQIPDGSITDTQLGSGAFTMGNITTTGSIRGPASFTIDPAAVGDNTGTVVIAGDLQVDGNSTTINSSTLLVEDKNITLARSASTASAANTAGISVAGANADLTYFSTGDKWSFNKPLDVVSGTAGSTVATFEGTYSGSGNVKLASFERSGSAVAAAVTYTDATTDMEFGTTTGHSLSLTTGNTRKLTITNAGDVTIAGGVFTTIHDITTVNKFKTTNNNTRSIISMESKDSSGNAVDLRLHALGDGPRGEIYTFTNHPLAFATNNAAPQMTLDTGGRLGINQTPSTNNFTLQVKGIQTNGTDGRVAYFKGYGTATSIGTTGPTVVLQNANNTVNNYTKLSFESAGAGETVSINSHNRDHSNHYGDMAFNTRGSGGYSEKMRIMANGNVGIGENDPDRQVHVKGSTTTGGRLKLENTSASFYAGTVMTASAREFHIGVGGASTSAGLANSLYFYDGTAGLNRMYLDASGNFNMISTLGAGASTAYGSMGNRIMFDNDYSDTQRGPNKIVTQNDGAWIAGLGISNNSADFYSGGNFTWLDSGGADTYVARMRLSDDGDLQIGYSGAGLQQADSNALTITTPASGGGQGISLKRLDSNNDQGLGQISWSNNTQDGLTTIMSKTQGATNSTILRIFCNEAGAERQVVEISPKGTAGDASLQVTNYLSNAFNHVQENLVPQLTNGETLYLGVGKENNTKNTGYLGYTWSSDASNNNYIHLSHWGSNSLFRVYGNGDYSFAGSNVSDRDKKENIKEVSGTSLDKITQIPIKSFKMKATLEEGNEIRHQKTGFIAQEVQPHLPDVVTGTDGEGDMGIDLTGIMAHIVRAMKELKDENDALKARITTLEG